MSVLAQPIGPQWPRGHGLAGRRFELAVCLLRQLSRYRHCLRGKTFSACAVIEQMDHVLGASGTASVAAAQNVSFTNA